FLEESTVTYHPSLPLIYMKRLGGFNIKGGLFMTEFFYATISIILAIIIFIFLFIWTKREKEKQQKFNNIYAVITVSNITSITAISRTLRMDSNETRELLGKLIEEAKQNKDYRLLKNAYINFQDDKIVL